MRINVLSIMFVCTLFFQCDTSVEKRILKQVDVIDSLIIENTEFLKERKDKDSSGVENLDLLTYPKGRKITLEELNSRCLDSGYTFN